LKYTYHKSCVTGIVQLKTTNEKKTDVSIAVAFLCKSAGFLTSNVGVDPHALLSTLNVGIDE